MTPSLEAVTTATLAKALDAASLRQQAAAANLANAGSEDYAAAAVGFEEQLAEARRSLRERGSVNPADLQDVQPQLEPQDGAVELDAEVARMAANAVHYQALVQGLARHFALLSAAAADGRK